MQEEIFKSSIIVYNSKFTQRQYAPLLGHVISLPVDFTVFEPGNAMGLQTAYSLPDGCVCWVGAQSEIKGWDIFLGIVRQNPDIPFVAVFKDQIPAQMPPNMRAFHRLPTKELVNVIGACRVGLCTSRMESQHLAGIEMGACGLPMVAPPVGVYYGRMDDFPGFVMKEGTEPQHYATAIRLCMEKPIDLDKVRAYWKASFDKPVIKAAWTALVEEVECSGQS